MLRKLLIVLSLFLFGISVKSQNIQLHYDLGDGREYFTSTVENFKPDAYGSTFFFVDFNYSKHGAIDAYWEVARDLKFWEQPIALHIEYNGGLNKNIQFNNCYLLGASYSWNANDFSKGFSLQAMYKYIEGNDKPNNFQLTAVWYLHLLDGKLTFSGFADFWKEHHTVSNDNFQNDLKKSNYIFLSEPQIWYNLNNTFSVGGELELSNDFAGMDGFKIMPTVAIKYKF